MYVGNVSDCMKAFLDDTQWCKHIKDPPLKQTKSQTFFEYIIILGILYLNTVVF